MKNKSKILYWGGPIIYKLLLNQYFSECSTHKIRHIAEFCFAHFKFSFDLSRKDILVVTVHKKMLFGEILSLLKWHPSSLIILVGDEFPPAINKSLSFKKQVDILCKKKNMVRVSSYKQAIEYAYRYLVVKRYQDKCLRINLSPV